MNTQTMPWIKLDHISYLHSEFRAKASVQARYAYHELVNIAPMQTPSFSIPNDDAVIAGWLNISVKQWLKVRDLVLSQFSLGEDGRFYCTMLVEIYSNKQEQKENVTTQKRSTSAERMAKKRQRDNTNVSHQNKCDAKCDAVVTACDSNVTQANVTSDAMSVTNGGIKGGDLDLDLDKDLEEEQEVKTKTSRDASVCDARFDLFWKNYPRKEKKQDAIKSWKKIKPNETLFNEILSAIDQQKTWASWLSGYIPHATTWLNGKRWEDEQPRQQNIVPLTNRPNSQSWQSKEDERKAFNKAAQEEFLRSFNSDNVIDGVSRHVG